MMAAALRRHGWELLGIVLTLFCLWLAVRGAHLSEVLAALVSANWSLILVAVVINVLVYAATAIRWQLLFLPRHSPALRRLLGGLLLAQLANTVLPAKLGPVVRAVYIGRVERISKVFVLTTVLGEKVSEGLTLLLVFALVAPLVPLPDWLSGPAVVVGVGSAVVLVGAWFLAGRQQRLGLLSKLAVGRLSATSRLAMGEAYQSLQDSLDVWRLPWIGLKVAGWSAIIWGTIAGMNYVVLRALKVQAPPVAALVLLVVLQAGARLPSAPANVGVFHWLVMWTLGLFGVSQNVALGYALVLHALVFLLPAVAGALVLIRLPTAYRSMYRGEALANAMVQPR